MTISALIDKQDNFEIIRDQIASILAMEVVSQKALAVTAGKDQADWDLRVFTERTNPWEQWLETTDRLPPIVNVWYDSSTFQLAGSNLSQRQSTEGTFNIDCYGRGVAEDITAGGHIPGDQRAAADVQRALMLVRNILMASEYRELAFPPGNISQRWPQSIVMFQPQFDGIAVQRVIAARISLQVKFNEFSPQQTEGQLCFLNIDVTRADNGEILFEADIDFS